MEPLRRARGRVGAYAGVRLVRLVCPVPSALVATWLLGELRFLRDQLWGPA